MSFRGIYIALICLQFYLTFSYRSKLLSFKRPSVAPLMLHCVTIVHLWKCLRSCIGNTQEYLFIFSGAEFDNPAGTKPWEKFRWDRDNDWQNLPPCPGWNRVKVFEHLGATTVVPVTPVDTSLPSNDSLQTIHSTLRILLSFQRTLPS